MSESMERRGRRRAELKHLAVAMALASVVVISGCGRSGNVDPALAAKGKPNVLVILVDDLGYADLSAYGGEIATPNIDRIAGEGRLLTNFHTTPLCATSRAELITGADHHLVGVGTLAESNPFYPGEPKYQGSLDGSALTMAQVLRDAGYHTYMSGKWHLGGGGPAQQGFERSFSLDYSAAFGSNFAPTAAKPESAARNYYEDGKQAQLPEDFFSTDYYTDKLAGYIGKDHGDGKPFFAYLAFQAVHFPLQVPDAYLDRYKGRYDAGYQAIRDARLQRQKNLGLIPADFKANPGDEATMLRFGQPGVLVNRPWESLSASDQQSEARIMEVFAGMLTNLDDNVGKLVSYLKQIGEYDNTFIVFMSDNGADGMGYGFIPYVDTSAPQSGLTIDNSLANYGKRSSFIFRSTRWAEAGNVPFRLFKGFTAEGGIAVAAIARLPGQNSGAAPSAALSSLLDIAPTVYALAGVPLPGKAYKGRSIAPPEGLSLLPVLNGVRGEVYGFNDVIADEVNDIRYVRRGPWKMTRVVNYMVPSAAELISHDWQLYNLDTDRGETTDVAAQNPAIVADLTNEWRAYVTRVGVKQPVLPPLLTPIDQ